MRVASQGGFHLLPGTDRARTRPRWQDWLRVAVVAIAVALVLAAVAARTTATRRAIRELPAEQRLVLLEHAVAELREVCGDERPDGLGAHCRDLAGFVAQFDECTGECQALARRELAPHPTR